MALSVAKILESIVRDSIIHHMFQNDLIDPNQHGFTSRKSYTTQLLTTMECWTQSLDSGICINVIYQKPLTSSHMPDYCLNLKHIVLEVIF